MANVEVRSSNISGPVANRGKAMAGLEEHHALVDIPVLTLMLVR
jgi:hypothetical protein